MNQSCTLPKDPTVFTPQTLSRVLQERREYVSSELLNICSQTIRPRVLCAGAASLREAEVAIPQIAYADGEFVVLDSSQERTDALQSEVSAAYFAEGDAFSASRRDLGTFHYVYALNLLNELPDVPASRAVSRLASLLRPGGRLLVTNFSSAVIDCIPALQRTFLRDEEQMARLCHAIPDERSMGRVIWRDRSDSLVYLEIER